MPRIVRGFVDGFIYHVINRGNGGEMVFHGPQDYQAFLRLMKEAKRQYPVRILAYCLMPNHFHMVLSPTKAEALSKWMQWVMTSHVRRYHRYYGTSGHIWQGRFKSFIVQQDEHLLTVLRYVESNPVRGGLARFAREWNWSSHKEMIGRKARKTLDDIPIDLPKEWETYVNAPWAEKDLERIRQCVNRQSPYGAGRWRLEMCRKLGLESTIRPRGRPRQAVGEKSGLSMEL